jgi:Na+-transporting NADH:ubiquinone oxidoreductase subunit NqrB
MNIGRQIEQHLRYPLMCLTAYETFALATKLVPSVSQIAVKHKIIIPILVGGLAIHLCFPPAIPKLLDAVVEAVVE